MIDRSYFRRGPYVADIVPAMLLAACALATTIALAPTLPAAATDATGPAAGLPPVLAPLPWNALVVAMLVRFPRLPRLPLLAAQGVAMALLVALQHGGNVTLPGAAGIGAASVLQAATAVYLIRDLMRLRFPAIDAMQAIRAFLAGGFVAPAAGAMLAAAANAAVGGDAARAAQAWWDGEVLMTAIFAPPVLFWSRAAVRKVIDRRRLGANLLGLIAILAWAWIAWRNLRFPFICIGVPMLLVAVRVGAFGAAVLGAAIALPLLALWIGGSVPPGQLVGGPTTIGNFPLLALVSMVLPPVALALSVQHQRLVQRAIATERRRMRTTLEAISDGVITCDEKGHVLYLNPAARDMTGLALDAALGRPIEQVLTLTSPRSGGAKRSMFARAAARGTSEQRRNPALLHSLDGSIRYVRDTASPVRAEGGIVSGWVIALHDVSASVLGEMEARQRAEQDTLTGLANRFRFEREASLALQVAQQQGIESCVAIIDLDSFKAVNDAAGHASGDEILRRAAGAIQSVLPPESLVARMGGDEFAVLMRQCGEAEALVLGRRIVQAILAIRILHDGTDYGVGASVGVAQARVAMAGLPAWIGAADDACYRAKRAGRGQCMA